MCTGIPVYADKSLIFARTMEFTAKMNSSIYVVPAGTSFQATYTVPEKQENGDIVAGETFDCKSWEAQYSFIGPNFLEVPDLIEGFNEKGLHVAGFYFPGYEDQYQEFKWVESPIERALLQKNTITQLSFVNWALSTCDSVDDVRDKLQTIRVCGSYFEALGQIPGVHWIVQDASGKCVVVEYLDNELNIFENPYGVITNSPRFDWHKTNINNYINLNAKNANAFYPRKPNGEQVTENEFLVSPLGQGSGMLGIPGDFTSPSRFIRALALSQAVDRVETNEEGVNLCWNLIDNVNIAIGTIKFSEQEEQHRTEHMLVDYTQWVSVSDLGELNYYYRTYDNPNIRVISLQDALQKAQNTVGKNEPVPIMVLPMDSKVEYCNVVSELTPVFP